MTKLLFPFLAIMFFFVSCRKSEEITLQDPITNSYGTSSKTYDAFTSDPSSPTQPPPVIPCDESNEVIEALDLSNNCNCAIITGMDFDACPDGQITTFDIVIFQKVVLFLDVNRDGIFNGVDQNIVYNSMESGTFTIPDNFYDFDGNGTINELDVVDAMDKALRVFGIFDVGEDGLSCADLACVRAYILGMIC